MATYPQPTENLAIFDPSTFISNEDPLTISNADSRYLRFPISQGSETISGNLTVTSTLTAATANITGTLTTGTFAPAIINCATLNSATGTNQTIGNNLTTNSISLGNGLTTGTINIGNGLTGGIIDIGKGTGGTITIANASTTTASVLIGTDASAFNDSTCVIGQNSALSINNATGSVNLSTASTSAGTLSIANEAGSNRTINIGRNNAITVNNGTTSTVSITGTTNINTGGTATSQIGNNSASSTVNLFGTVNINSSGSQSTAIGNSTGTTTILKTLAQPAVTAAYTNQNSTTQYIGGTYFSAFTSGATGIAAGTSYAPFSSALAWNAFGSSVEWNSNGGITLPSGVYLCWMALNLNGSADAITDMRMGILTRSTAPGTTETDWTDNLPILITATEKNYTVYFHKTDSTDNSPNDSEQFNISGCVVSDGTSALYPWIRWNKLGSSVPLRGNVVFTRIGS